MGSGRRYAGKDVHAVIALHYIHNGKTVVRTVIVDRTVRARNCLDYAARWGGMLGDEVVLQIVADPECRWVCSTEWWVHAAPTPPPSYGVDIAALNRAEERKAKGK